MASCESLILNKSLSDGKIIPLLGFGTGSMWFKEVPTDVPDYETVQSLKMAASAGIRHFDTAEKYRTEAEVGLAIKESGIARSELFVTTKVLYGVRNITQALDDSLVKLGLDYVDLYLIHEPFWAKDTRELTEAWTAMESVKHSQKARSIGVSNFTRSQIQSLLDSAQDPPVLHQMEYHPYLQDPDFIAWQKSMGITVAAYASLTPLVRAAPGPLDTLLQTLSMKLNVSRAAILLRWCYDQGLIAISTTNKREELLAYLEAMSFTLSPQQVTEISEVAKSKRFRSFYADQYTTDPCM